MTTETENTDLIVPIALDAEKALAMFTGENEFDKLYAQIKEKTDAHEPDLSTAKGRDEIASLAHKVARTKTALDKIGLQVKDDAQKTVDKVNATRKKMCDDLDALKVEVRKPLTEYEAAEKQKDDAVDAALNALADLKNIPFDATVQTLEARLESVEKISGRNDWRGKEDKAEALIDACRSVLNQAKESAIERERIAEENAKLQREKEEMAAKERADQERREQEARDLKAKEMAEQEAKDAQQAKIDALEREKADAEQRAKDAEKRAQQEAQAAERAKIEAQEQFERQEQEKKQREAQERKDRELMEKEIAEAKARDAERQKQLTDEAAERSEQAMSDLAPFTSQKQELLKEIKLGKIRHISFT